MLAHVLSQVRAFGGPLVVNAHRHADEVRAFLEEHAPEGFVSQEEELLGTAGGLHRARPVLGDDTVLVWNADILARLDLALLRRTHERRARHQGATLAVHPAPRGDGNVGVDARGHVVRLRRHTVRPGEVRGGYFLGVHVLGAALLARLPERGGLIEDAYLPALAGGAPFVAWETVSPFHDIGTVSAYLSANLAWLEERGVAFFVAHGARVGEGVTLARSVVGEGAIVEGEETVEASVVWPGARVRAPQARQIVTPFGSVRA